MKFTKHTYRVARNRAIQAIVDSGEELDEDTYLQAVLIVERGRREKNLWKQPRKEQK